MFPWNRHINFLHPIHHYKTGTDGNRFGIVLVVQVTLRIVSWVDGSMALTVFGDGPMMKVATLCITRLGAPLLSLICVKDLVELGLNAHTSVRDRMYASRYRLECLHRSWFLMMEKFNAFILVPLFIRTQLPHILNFGLSWLVGEVRGCGGM